MKNYPGAMRHRISILRETRTNDEMGGGVINTAVFAVVWSAVKHIRANEIFTQDKIQTPRGMLFTIRNRNDLLETDRIVWDNKAHNIREIRYEGEKSLYLQIFAESGVAL